MLEQSTSSNFQISKVLPFDKDFIDNFYFDDLQMIAYEQQHHCIVEAYLCT